MCVCVLRRSVGRGLISCTDCVCVCVCMCVCMCVWCVCGVCVWCVCVCVCVWGEFVSSKQQPVPV